MAKNYGAVRGLQRFEGFTDAVFAIALTLLIVEIKPPGTPEGPNTYTSLTHATVPARWGVGASFTGVSGMLIAARADWEGWSSLGDLGRAGLGVTDTWDVGAGLEVRGPALFGSSLPLRVGYRHRTLPFTVGDTRIIENSFSFGAGVPISGGRSRIDLGVERANRGSTSGISEKAWILSAGFMVRP